MIRFMKVLSSRPIGSLMLIHWGNYKLDPILVKEYLKNGVVSIVRLLSVVYGEEWVLNPQKGYTFNELKDVVNNAFYE